MSGLEIMEFMEHVEQLGVTDLQEQREQLRLQAEAAKGAGNVEKANYFQGEIAKLEKQLAQSAERPNEIAFLGEGHAHGHSESYWKKAAAKEFIEHGKTTWYDSCNKYLEEAIKNNAERSAKK